MKKMIQLLTIISTMILGINGVKAADLSDLSEIFTGSCNQPFPLSDSCYYKCGYYNDKSNTYFEFYYTATKKNSDTIEHEVSSPTISTYNYESKEYMFDYKAKYWDVKYYPNEQQFLSSITSVCPLLFTSVEVQPYLTIENGKNVVGKKYNIYIDFDETYKEPDTPEEIDTSCGFLGGKSSKVVLFLQKIFKYIKIIIPVLIVVLSIADFIKVIGTGKDDDMKKAINRFVKRIIIAIAFVLIPFLISLIINISGVTSEYSGINDGLKAVFCILG